MPNKKKSLSRKKKQLHKKGKGWFSDLVRTVPGGVGDWMGDKMDAGYNYLIPGANPYVGDNSDFSKVVGPILSNIGSDAMSAYNAGSQIYRNYTGKAELPQVKWNPMGNWASNMSSVIRNGVTPQAGSTIPTASIGGPSMVQGKGRRKRRFC